jgi:hypothetical protein
MPTIYVIFLFSVSPFTKNYIEAGLNHHNITRWLLMKFFKQKNWDFKV